jgi:ADP-ribose pyrophosphatase YjhB (NUDIX family)
MPPPPPPPPPPPLLPLQSPLSGALGGAKLQPAPFRSFRLDLTALAAETMTPAAASSPILAQDLAALAERLAADGANTLWIEATMAQGAVLSAAAAAGFSFHHAAGARAVLMRWLPGAARACKVPRYATHQVGVAGCVIDAEHRLLLVREAGRGSVVGWKLPGGLAEPNESFGETAAREVLEETGVHCRFRSVLSLRHLQGGAAFGVSDIYVVCLMRPARDEGARAGAGAAAGTREELPLRIDPEEIEAACWMDAAEFARTTKHPLTRHAALLASHELRREQAREARGGGAGAVTEEEDAEGDFTVAETDVFFAISGRVSKVYSAGRAPRPERAAASAVAAADAAAAAARASASA